jgi:glutamine synthetase
LGAHEAPPAIVSIFLGDELTSVVESIVNGTNYCEPDKSLMRIGVDVLPAIPKDTTDRNRTSPLAFTGNKFELRMLGSSQSIAGPNVALNTIMAEELRKFADELEVAADFDSALQNLVSKALREHQRIIFNGNGYSQDWQEEAARRGLSNHRSTAESLPTYASPKNIDLVTRHGIFTEEEFLARNDIHMDSYCKIVSIEAKTSVDMVLHQILPAAISYTNTLCDTIMKKQSVGATCKAEKDLVGILSGATDALYDLAQQLKEALAKVPTERVQAIAYYHDVISVLMEKLRAEADILEQNTDKSYWPYPTYSDLLFY